MAEGIAAQDRGEVAKGSTGRGDKIVGASNDFTPATAADLGIRRDEMHEARAIRRAGELINQIKAAKTGPKPELGAGGGPQLGKGDAARDAGMSPRQAKTAQRVANVPEAEFEARTSHARIGGTC